MNDIIRETIMTMQDLPEYEQKIISKLAHAVSREYMHSYKHQQFCREFLENEKINLKGTEEILRMAELIKQMQQE